MITIAKRLLTSLFLFLVSGAAFATDFTDNTAVANHTDLSIGYLGQVFGTVGNVLQGSSGQMLGQLFYKLNEGIIIVAGLWLCYTVFTIVIRSAQEGSFMGPNKNVALVFLKIAVGFGLLVPNPSTGYSLLQDLVMQVVVQGVGLADQTWQYGLEYVNNGGVIWHRPEDSGAGGGSALPLGDDSSSTVIDSNTVTSLLGGATQDKKGPGQQIFANEVCMYSSQDNQNQAPQSGTNIGPAVGGSPSVQYDVVSDDAAYKYEFPGIGDTTPIGPGAQKCGSVSWDIQNACTGNGSNATKCTMAKQALRELVTGLEPAAKRYYCSQHASAASCAGISTDNVASENEQYFFSSLVNYVNIAVPLVQLNAGGAESQKDFITEAESEGWLSAGRYYWDLSQIQYFYDTISNVENYKPNVAQPTLTGQPLLDANSALNDSYGYMTPLLTLLNNYTNAQNAGDTGSSAPMFAPQAGSAGLSIAASILGGPIGDIVNLIMMFTTAHNGGWMGQDPILFLHRVGMSCIAIAGDIWLGFLVVIAAVLLAAGICNAEYDAKGAITEVINWFKPLLTILAAAFWGVGFVLGFYVPMYPYVIYIFGVIGWIIAVIEAMVAASLVCFGLTHPEGHDFLGEAKQAAMLLLGIFLRPTLMVIGLIAGMILSYVALRILVYTFAGFAYDLFSPVPVPNYTYASGNILGAAGELMMNSMLNSMSMSGFILCLLVFPLTLIVFTGLVYVVTTQSFSLIFALPDNILRWIGAPAQSSHSERMAEQLRGGMGTVNQSLGQGTNQSISTGDSRAKEMKEKRVERGAADDKQ